MTLSLLALLGTSEIIIIALVVLVLFGAKKVPELMKGVGTGIKEFKKASRDVQDEFARASAEEPPAPTPSPTPAVPRKASDTVTHDVGHS